MSARSGGHVVLDTPRNPFVAHVARVLLIIDAFSPLRGWDTLARVDFLLRYPSVAAAVVGARGKPFPVRLLATETERLASEGLPLRYKFGPWDAAYYPVIGRLVGTGLVRRTFRRSSVELLITDSGRATATDLSNEGWQLERDRAHALALGLRLTGARLTALIEQIL